MWRTFSLAEVASSNALAPPTKLHLWPPSKASQVSLEDQNRSRCGPTTKPSSTPSLLPRCQVLVYRKEVDGRPSRLRLWRRSKAAKMSSRHQQKSCLHFPSAHRKNTSLLSHPASRRRKLTGDILLQKQKQKQKIPSLSRRSQHF